MFKRVLLLCSALVLTLVHGVCLADDPQVDAMGQAFLADLPSNWHSQVGSWQYFNVASCFAAGQYCYGNNPSSPYGYPSFGNSQPISPFQMSQNEAVVIFFKTPPPMRYFGFTQYLMNRDGNAYYIFASMSDTLNLLEMSTLQATAPVSNIFNQYAVLVWTADMNTLAGVQSLLAQQGIAAANVNFIPMPVTLPLYMGYGARSDTFSMVMRTALPNVQSDLNTYMANSPFYVIKVGPNSPPPISPAPVIGYASDVSGISENPASATALSSLVANIQANYKSTFSFAKQVVTYSNTIGWDCIATLTPCSADNHDDLIAMDTTQAVTVKNLNDIVIIAGVNHNLTGEALYINHTVNDTVQSTGIFSISDPQFTEQSALYHAGVTSPTDPRIVMYKNLYAYAISYNCGKLSFCQNIPTPTTANPIGLSPGESFLLWARAYENPNTKVRPDSAEIIQHTVLIGTHK
jgi:hypothetical protein